MNEADVLIIGGGLSGLACATKLHQAGVSFRLIEASDRLGGRVATDPMEGFLLDRGFQVFLSAYPTAKAMLSYDQLDLRPFEPGALIRCNGKEERLSDPWRRPQHLLATAFSSAASLSDKLRIASFRRATTQGDLQSLWERPESTTLNLLRDYGFSETIIERFFQPFLGGVFLDPDLQTSSRMCEFVFRMFSTGQAALPAQGMQTIPLQLAQNLPADCITTSCQAKKIDEGKVELDSGEKIQAKKIVVATTAPVAARLLNKDISSAGMAVRCVYFAADSPPLEEPVLVLNGDGKGPVNNLCVPSQVSSHYAPPGKSLISATVLGSGDEQHLEDSVRRQLRNWYGQQVDRWRHLKTYNIDYALPRQSPPFSPKRESSPALPSGLFVCGDHCDTGSINGALESGCTTARAVLEQLGLVHSA